MASLSFLLGMVPGTEKVETADDQLRADLQTYKDYEKSDELKHYLELEKEVTSSGFVLKKKKIKKEKYKASEAFRKEERYNKLTKRSKGEEKSAELTELEEYINSEEFIKQKQYLIMKPAERYETTEEYQKEIEYQTLKKSEEVIWYYKTKKKYPFKEIERWDLTFDEKFNGSKLDTSKWMTRYFWGDKTMDSSFVLPDDMSFITDGDNIEFYDNKARIVTKAGSVEGIVWRAGQGFVSEDFDYTSGLISTAKSFRQKYGVFKAKIKMAGGSVAQAFWMVSETMLPHIDIARFENGKLHSDFFWGKGNTPQKSVSKTGGAKYADEYYIFTLEWSPNKLVWKINDKVFKTQISGVPQEEMYINFSSNLKKGASESGLPSAMEIDWVRVYKLKEKG
ncbi:MAG: family 16 glycosylhydrolase [Bacteroidales bacterium]|nr:family 16 glycosylhydrolase [Bacteroidales bacterium]